MLRVMLAVVLLFTASCAADQPAADPTPQPTVSPTAAPRPEATPTPSPSPSSSTSRPSTPTPRRSPASYQRWSPRPGTAWQWQLDGTLDLSIDVPVYDVDGERTTKAQVDELHRRGRRAICYVNVGAYENFRPDKARFPAQVLGKTMDGWPDERWLDIRRWDLLAPIMAARFGACRAKGFDAIEPDNVDAYSNESGFPLTASDQLRYNRRIAMLAHRIGLSVGLKNDLEQVRALQPSFDFAVNEECMKYDECALLTPFRQAGKAVLHVEYDLAPAEFCARAKQLGFSSMRKPLILRAERQPC
ncbi:endo alpha-1,4 polygalactosaminidase [Kribbella sp. NBC_01245]|uniref:endo alpha-1,4 polygalactosaminidase n=1 Tax=Kribbella sp. NBC_01245 TaxID=2903578 RepID=UPI002E294C8C|nr:endo alpha-1,4 polygalactosaminidase [Kribbella sp. NBC_01245]